MGGSSDSPILPTIAGMVIGVAFIAALAYSIGNLSERQPLGSGRLYEFDAVEQNLPELKLFLNEYANPGMTEYFGRSQNGTVQFIYVAPANIDKDGDGYNETNRRLEFSVLYDESGGHMLAGVTSYEPARVKQIEVRCREQIAISIDDDKAFSDIVPPAFNGQVNDFIKNTKCLA